MNDRTDSSAPEGEPTSQPAEGGAEGSKRRAGLELLDEGALRKLLATEPMIEQAKGLLMGHYRVGAEEAFVILRRWSAEGHIKVRDLAARLVWAVARPGPGPFDPLVELAELVKKGEGQTRDA